MVPSRDVSFSNPSFVKSSFSGFEPPLRKDAALPAIPGTPAPVWLLANDAGFSPSGGGVGGNMCRLIGGSDCCLPLLCKPGLTRLVAPNEMFSGARSSLLVSSRIVTLLFSEPVKPANVLDRSAAATRRALPR